MIQSIFLERSSYLTTWKRGPLEMVCDYWGSKLGLKPKHEVFISDVEVEGYMKVISYPMEADDLAPLQLGAQQIEDHYSDNWREVLEELFPELLKGELVIFWVKL